VKQSASQKESLTKAAKYYHAALGEAEEYLAGRGITMEQATHARLGVVLEPLTGHEAYLNRLSIPYITRSGVVDIRFRSMDLSEPKYMGMAGATTHLYNVNAGTDFGKSLSRELGNLVVVQMPEGEDVNSMYRLHGAEYFKHKIESVQ